MELDAESHSDGEHVAISIRAAKGPVDSELRLDVELEDAERFHRHLGEAIDRSKANWEMRKPNESAS